jgi:hypothetical protein
MCTVLYCLCVNMYCTVLFVCKCVLYCTVLYCTVLYCTLLYCTVLYCTVLHCTVLYCTVLYGTVLYCTVLLPPGANPIAVNKYINTNINIDHTESFHHNSNSAASQFSFYCFYISKLELYRMPQAVWSQCFTLNTHTHTLTQDILASVVCVICNIDRFQLKCQKNTVSLQCTQIAPPAEHCHNLKNTTFQERGKTTGHGDAIASTEWQHFSPLVTILENRHVTLFH